MHLFQRTDTPVETTRSRLESVAFLERDTFFQRFSWLSAASSSSGDESSRGSEVEHLWASFVHDSARTRSSSRSSSTRAAQYLHQAALLCDDLHQAASEHEAVSSTLSSSHGERIVAKSLLSCPCIFFKSSYSGYGRPSSKYRSVVRHPKKLTHHSSTSRTVPTPGFP